MLSHFTFRDECIFSCSLSVTAPAVDFESTGFSAGRMVKRAVLHKYYENDYLCYVRVVTDADEEVLEHNDYLEPLTLTMEQGSIRQRQGAG